MKIKEIFKFVEGSNVWNLTTSETEEVFAGDTYVPTAMGRTEIESKNELSKANIEVSFSIDNTFARRWMNTSIDSNMTVTVWTKQDDIYLVAWKGRLSSVKPNDQSIKLVFESIFTSMRRPGLRRRYQRTCGHVLYGRGCNLDKNSFAVAAVASAINGADVTVAQAALQADGWYTGGMIEAPDGTLRFIMNHVGTTLTLIRPIDSLSLSTLPVNIRIFPGCDRTRETCVGRFNNLFNNGAFPFIPVRNPFTGNSFT